MQALSWRSFVFWLVFVSSLFAQTGKHHRVIEIENFLKDKVEKIFLSRFPDQSYMVSVSIEPLRDLAKDKYALDEDGLPYFEIEKNYIDQWDDPKVSNYQLLTRVKKIQIDMALPDSINPVDVADFKESVFSSLNLISGRDEMRIERKSWQKDKISVMQIGLIFGIVFVSLLGLWLIMRFAVGKSIARAMAKNPIQTPDSGVSSAPAPAMAAVAPSTRGASNSLGGSSETLSLRLTDTLKVKHFVQEMVERFASNEKFPSLKDMIELDRLGQSNSGQLGALLMCFPVPSRRRLFSLSKGSHWLEAMYHATEIGPEALHVLERIERHIGEDRDLAWQELLIRVWKMEAKEQVSFLGQMDKTEAFSILAELPQNLSLPLAREAYPGSWGVLLESETRFEPLSTAQIRKHLEKIKELSGDRDNTVFDIFRKDKELLEFLRFAPVTQEKEIYTSLPKKSMIASMRPPFYKVLEASEAEVAELMAIFSVEDWAYALFNVPREQRKELEAFFSDKELKLYRSYLMGFDKEGPSAEEMGLIREQIAVQLDRLQQSGGLEEALGEELDLAS